MYKTHLHIWIMEYIQRVVAFLNQPKRMQHSCICINNDRFNKQVKSQYELIKQDNILWFNRKMERETKVYMELKNLFRRRLLQDKLFKAAILKKNSLLKESSESEHNAINAIVSVPRFLVIAATFAIGCIYFRRNNYI